MSDLTVQIGEAKLTVPAEAAARAYLEKFHQSTPLVLTRKFRAEAMEIGDKFEDGIYAGLTLDGNKPAHLVLLPGDADKLTWNRALLWAEEQGGVLPSRTDALQLFLRLKDEFQQAAYWTADQHASAADYAWLQYFGSGLQLSWRKVNELRARAVRRVVI